MSAKFGIEPEMKTYYQGQSIKSIPKHVQQTTNDNLRNFMRSVAKDLHASEARTKNVVHEDIR